MLTRCGMIIFSFTFNCLKQTYLPNETGQTGKTEGREHVNFEDWEKKSSRMAVLVSDVARPSPPGPFSKNPN